ncbi:MAG: hypothetical protein HY315_01890 [Acidobacteria bacterium]|nr:hypothetical protein [Acidobacteriota bacterium]
MNKLLRIFYILFCFEVGIFLLVFPWLRLWETHGLLLQFPAFRTVMMNNFFRGAVSGLGIVNLVVGGVEVVTFGKRSKSDQSRA